jgi:hypothetical protein
MGVLAVGDLLLFFFERFTRYYISSNLSLKYFFIFFYIFFNFLLVPSSSKLIASKLSAELNLGKGVSLCLNNSSSIFFNLLITSM